MDQLHITVEGIAKRIAQGEIGMQIPRYANMLDNIHGAANYYRGYAVTLKVASNQTHGLVAHGSQRHQQGDVSLIILQSFQYFRCIFFERLTLAIGGRD